MLKDRVFQLICSVVIAEAVLHQLGISAGFYATYQWFDLLTHFLGGFIIGGLGLWILLKTDFRTLFFRKNNVPSAQILFLGFAVAVMVGIGWEIFEALIDPFLSKEAGYIGDTALDLIADSAGGLLVAFLFFSNRKS